MGGIRTAGRLVILLGLVLAFAWMFTPLDGAGDRSLWQSASRFDVVMAACLVGGAAIGVAAFFVSNAELLDRALGVVAGATAAALALLALESQWEEPLLVEFGCLAALLLLAGAALLSLPAPTAERFAASLRGAHASRPGGRATARQGQLQTAPTIPAGWYPDPSGQYATRYWDGHVWTDHVQ